jgi:NAD(P)-dependent dehydrogenase (short-subunit alcohol dehydrogenase family)
MELQRGDVAVVTGAASGIGRALADAFAARGLRVVLADVEHDRLEEAAAEVATSGVETLAVLTDVRHEDQVVALAAAAVERFGGVHVVCNNAGVAAASDPWRGPLSAWEWTMGVNFWGVVHGVRAFLPHLGRRGHIVNTASVAGLFPGAGAAYDASKHAVVALTESLYLDLGSGRRGVGVSVLCPGWVRTRIGDADRNWPDELGTPPQSTPTGAVVWRYMNQAIDEGDDPAAVAAAVVHAVEDGRFWVVPQDGFLDVAARRWQRIAQRLDPEPPRSPGMPPHEQLASEMVAAARAAAPKR